MIGKKIIANFPDYNSVIHALVPDLTYVSKDFGVNLGLKLDCNVVDNKIAYFRKLSEVDPMMLSDIDNWSLDLFDFVEN